MAIATVRSAMKLSAVSPERWETIAPHPALRAISMETIVSVREPSG